MAPLQIYDLQIGQSMTFGPEYGTFSKLTELAGNVGRSRKRNFEVTEVPGGSLVTRLDDKPKKPAKPAKAARAEAPGPISGQSAPARKEKIKRITIAERLLAVEPGTPQFFPARELNPSSLRATASTINARGERRLQVVIVTRPNFGTWVTSLDLSTGITDASGAPINFANGERMRKYPFDNTGPGEHFTLPPGATDISALRGSVQYHRTRHPTRQYRITRNEDGGFTVTCSVRS